MAAFVHHNKLYTGTRIILSHSWFWKLLWCVFLVVKLMTEKTCLFGGNMFRLSGSFLVTFPTGSHKPKILTVSTIFGSPENLKIEKWRRPCSREYFCNTGRAELKCTARGSFLGGKLGRWRYFWPFLGLIVAKCRICLVLLATKLIFRLQTLSDSHVYDPRCYSLIRPPL